MSEQNNADATPTIEDVINENLTGKTRQNALDYVAFLKANGIMPEEPGALDALAAIRCGFASDGFGCLFNVIPHTNSWEINTGNWDSELCRSEYQNYPADEEIKEFARAHYRICQNFKTNGKECGCGSQPGRRVTVFGKDIFHTCHGGVEFTNPDGEELANLKKLTMVLDQMITDAAKNDKPYVPEENEWLPVKGADAHTGRPLVGGE